MQIKKFLLLGISCTCVFVTSAKTKPSVISINNAKRNAHIVQGKTMSNPIHTTKIKTREGEQKPGTVKGRITTSDGSIAPYVSVVLKGTSFGAISNEDGEYQLKKVPAGDYIIAVSAVGLYPKEKSITVTGKSALIVDFSLNENLAELETVNIDAHKKKFKVDKVSSSLRLQTPLLELPQNIRVVSSEIMADQLAFDIVDGVTRNVSGAVRTGHWDAQYANISMRGFSIPAFRNGMNLKTPWGPLADDAATIDRIEFVKGPAGFMMANGEPGGIYNVVTKKPTGMNNSSVSFSAGGYNLARVAVDLDTKVTNDGKLLFRLNTAAQTKNSFNKYNYNDKYVIAPVISYQIDSATKFTLEYTHQHVEALALGNYGFSKKGFGDVPPSFFLGDPSLDPAKLNDHNVTAYLSHKLNKDWTFNAQLAYMNYSLEGGSVWLSSLNDAGDMRRYYNIGDELAVNKNAQLMLQGEVTTGPVVHRILGGLDMGNLKTWGDFSSVTHPDLQLAGNATFNIYNPTYGIPTANIPVFDRSKSIRVRSGSNTYATEVSYTGIYLQDELRFLDEKLRLTLAGRFTHTVNVGKTTVAQLTENAFTPRVGISYSIMKDFSVYGLYDQSFLPQAGVDYEKNAFKPLRGNNIEAGLKKDWFDGKWNSSISVYKITKKNMLTPDPRIYTVPGFPTTERVQLGEVQSKGIEFDLVGEVAKGLNLTFNYAFTQPKVTKDETVPNPTTGVKNNKGTYLSGTAKHITNTWLSYRYKKAGSILNGIGLTGGYQMQLDRFAGAGFTKSNFADYIRFDAGISYAKGKFSISGLVNNLLDRRLFTQGTAANPTVATSYYTWIYEVPRNVRISAKYSFK